MPAARAQLEKAVPKQRCRLRETAERPMVAPYTDEQIELFALRLAAALCKPGAFDPICDRIDDLLKKARVRR